MKTSMRLLLAGASLALLTAWHIPTKLTAPAAVPPTYAYKFEDQRPKKWFDSGPESVSLTNCAYGIFRIGQEDIDQPLPAYLHAMLAERFGDRLAGKTVALRGFSVHLNQAVEIRRQLGVAMPGLITSLHAKEVGCSAEDTFGGYTVGEVQGERPLIVAIDVFIDGQRFKGRAIAPGEQLGLPRKKAPQEAKDQWNAAVDALVAAAVKNLGDRIEKGLFADSVAPAAATQAVAVPAGAAPAPAAASN
jgi:hypothetical protein